MDSKYVFVAALFLLVANFGVSADETPQEKLTKLSENAKQVIQNVTSILGLPDIETDPEKIKAIFNAQTKILADNVKEAVKKFQTAASDKDGFIQPIIANLNETINSLQTPDQLQKSQQMTIQFNDSFTRIAEQFGKISDELKKEVEPQGNFHQITTNALEQMIAAANTLKDKISNSGKGEVASEKN